MKRQLASAIGVAITIAVCSAWIAPRVMAEPILGDESLGDSSSVPTPKQEVTDALSLFKARDYEGALKALTNTVKRNPDMPPAQVLMAGLFLQSNMPKEARAALERATVDAPNDPEVYLLLAGLAMHDQDTTKAETLYRKANGLMPSLETNAKRRGMLQPQIYRGLAMAAEARKDWAGAQKSLEEWANLDPKNSAPRHQIAYCLFQQKNPDGALEKLREVAKINKGMAAPEAILAQFYQQAGDNKNAGNWIAAALKAAPKDLRTRLAAGQWAMEAGQLEEAQKHAVAATRIAPKSTEAKLFRGVTALFQKDYAAAESIFESAVNESPKNVVATNNLALALVGQEDELKSKRALEYAEANAKRYPTLPEIASTYGLVLYKLGRIDEAEKALQTAASLASSDIDTAYVIARVSVDRGHKAEARQVLETALKNTKPFMFRQEAEELLQEVKK